MRIYENYKNISSSFWLSHIPQHWEYKKMKYKERKSLMSRVLARLHAIISVFFWE